VTLVEAQSLRSHTLYLLIKCVNFLIKPRVLRSRRIAAAQLFERFLNGEFGCFSHGNYPKTWRATSSLGENLQPDIVPWDNSAIRVFCIQFDCECVRPHSTHRALMRVDGPGYPQVRGRYARPRPLRSSPPPSLWPIWHTLFRLDLNQHYIEEARLILKTLFPYERSGLKPSYDHGPAVWQRQVRLDRSG